MEQPINNSNLKTRINLSRITPIALVVGAAGFLGSNLVDSLLEKGIQVIGVDNFSKGKKENLSEAVKNRNFHLLDSNAANLKLDMERLDYIFIVASHFNSDAILHLFLKHNARCLFVSWIDLYGHKTEVLYYFKEEEAKLAKFAKDNNLNARILRLGSVYGPRMHFEVADPIIRLVHAALTDRIQKEIALDFSSRALYVEDAVNLIIKSVMGGATAQRIFDGVLPAPVKVTEVKQVLLDPLWYEEKNFVPSELPPWPTPNLEKTMKFLNWRPGVGLVEALRKTLSYFRDHELVPSFGSEIKFVEVKEAPKILEGEKKAELAAFRNAPKQVEKKGSSFKMPKFGFSFSRLYLLLAAGVIVAGIFYPFFALFFGVATFKIEVQNASNSLSKGEFEKVKISLDKAKSGISEAQEVIGSLEIIGKSNIFKDQIEMADFSLNIASQSLDSIKSATSGIEALYKGLKAVTTETKDSPYEHFASAEVDLEYAEANLSSAQAYLKSKKLPEQALALSENLESFNNQVKAAHAASILLPKIVSSEKSYLILIQNNTELRPAGGAVGSYGLISFEGGKLKKLQVSDVYSIDEKLTIHVEPPKEIKEDLGQSNWYLRDSNFEADFPTSAKQAEWFFKQEVGVVVGGVLALDVTALEVLLAVLGPLDSPELKERITSENLTDKLITNSSQANFLTAVTNGVFNKIFFLPNQNWPSVIQALGKSLEEKHVSVFLDDPKLFSYLVSQNWSGVLPRAQEPKVGIFLDFLSVVEANLGANWANYYLDRKYELETIVGKEGEVKHRLKINYTNSSPSEAFPAGVYKNRIRFYLPFGTKLDRVLWGETNITRDATSFVDYGRSAYSLLLEVAPKQQKALILDYEVPGKLEFIDGKAVYRLDIIKQAGTLKDPLEWKITYPIDYQVVSQKEGIIAPQEQKIVTDLASDRSFEVVFTK